MEKIGMTFAKKRSCGVLDLPEQKLINILATQ
jgi:hypothetical protein